MARRRKRGFYHFFIVLPDRLFPFSATINGRRVRGRLAYEFRVSKIERKYGPGHLGVLINLYRSFFHIVASVAVIILFALLARKFFGDERALYVLLSFMTVLVTYQEFYYHRREYGQLWRKGVLDWLSWMVPIGVYLFFLHSV
jgi:hypothetical protein